MQPQPGNPKYSQITGARDRIYPHAEIESSIVIKGNSFFKITTSDILTGRVLISKSRHFRTNS